MMRSVEDAKRGMAGGCWTNGGKRWLGRIGLVWPAMLLVNVFFAQLQAGCSTFGSTGYVGHEKSVRPGVNDKYKHADVNEWIKRFERDDRGIYKHRREIVASVGVKPGTVMADIGAGTGFLTVLFARQVGPDGKVFAVDITPEFLKHIATRAREQGLNNVEPVHCKADSVGLPSDSIDLAFLCDVYHHFEYPKSSLRSIHRALKPGGELVVIDFERIPGTSREWVVKHVRAGKETVTKEIQNAGFELVSGDSKVPYLKENYLLRFRKVE